MCEVCRHYEKLIETLKRARATGEPLTPEQLDEVIETVQADYAAFVNDAAEASLYD